MIKHFNLLRKKDNLSLLNKRLRLYEYIVTPLLKRLSNNTYRILNSKTVSINKLKGIFNISPMFLIKSMVNNELLRYSGAVNDMDLFTCALKFSNRGAQSIGEGNKKTVSIAYRGIYISHLGRLSLNSCSNSDPGMSGVLTPFVETDGFYFNKGGEFDPHCLK